MPKLGIDDNNPASARGVPWSSSSAGIRKATPLMKTNALAVTRSETTTIDQRRPVLILTVPVGSVGIDPCLHRPCDWWGRSGDGPGCADPDRRHRGFRGRPAAPGFAALATATGDFGVG